MKRVTRFLIGAVPAVLLFAGCSSAPTAKSIAKDEAAAAEVRAKAEAERTSKAQKQAERELGNVPECAMTPPKNDADGFYAVGMADSSKIDLAIKKAMLQAEFQLAKSYRAIVSGNERQFQRDQGGSSVTERYTLLIDSVVDRMPLGGYQVLQREVKPMDGKFHSFVLLKLSYDQANKLVASSRTGQADASIDEQFAELERRLDKYRADRLQEEATIRAEKTARVSALDKGTRELAARQADAVAARPADGAEQVGAATAAKQQ